MATRTRAKGLRAGHVHLNVRDLRGALRWCAKVWDLRPVFANDHLAVLPFGPLTLLLDQARADSVATVAFASDDCDRDFRRVVRRGAKVLEAPEDRHWGVRAAYLRGPGRLTFEIEAPVRR